MGPPPMIDIMDGEDTWRPYGTCCRSRKEPKPVLGYVIWTEGLRLTICDILKQTLVHVLFGSTSLLIVNGSFLFDSNN